MAKIVDVDLILREAVKETERIVKEWKEDC